jgi:hypothetical protein
MKAEDVRLLWRIASLEACGVESGYEPPDELMLRFARACEKHGVERAKAQLVTKKSWDGLTSWPDWSALDAEVAKENET